ncbi:unnamed protein product [Ranitomeya imitator]|uniref:SERTA domain-containing protein n=1 Tax=Ranitomeya imitator TaxID=111125 RepID=A0ABN9LH35_9NEOB|nr:unnamed protein product [Ranitomeya imitator]
MQFDTPGEGGFSVAKILRQTTTVVFHGCPSFFAILSSPQRDAGLIQPQTFKPKDSEEKKLIYLRATDVKLMRQLLIINENIESIKYMMEEKDIVTSQGSSLSGSLCSLLESRDSSLQGSYTSLHGYSDGMDDISVGSYLDTLADIVPGHCTPDFDVQQNPDDFQPLCNDSSHQYDEYYCFR